MNLNKDLREFIELLNSSGVEYLIVGGHAVGFHAIPRYTRDIDILVGTTAENAARMERVVAQFGFRSLGLAAKDFEVEDQIVQLGHPPNRIDLLTSITGVNFAEAWPKRVAAQLDGIPVWLLDRESLVANKRATGRSKDRADLEALGEL